jgi:hypothetical protein
MLNSHQTLQATDSNAVGLYDGHDLCSNLSPGQMCFRAKTYNEGVFDTVFHEHVPSYRLSQERASEVLRSLVARYSEWPGRFILHSLLNRRGGTPQCYPGYVHHVSYPELGVIRHTVSASNAHAWHDSVLSKAAFRRPAANPPEIHE